MPIGVCIEKGPQDWQIFQQENGFSKILLSGQWKVPESAAKLGIASAIPVVRVSREEDGFPVIPWQTAAFDSSENHLTGTWSITLAVPAGGLYKIETGLNAVSVSGEYRWQFRGDVRFHIGVGNVFLIAGQSNAAGYAADSAFDPPDLRVHLFRNRLQWELACHPMNETTDAENSPNADIRVNGASPYLSFARRFADFSACPVGLIQSAMSGQPIARWDTRQKGDLFRNMIDRVRQTGGKIAGVLWYQGCTDASESGDYARYEKIFARLVAETREQLGYSVPFFTFQLNRMHIQTDDHYWGIVREAQRRAALTLNKVYVLPTLDVLTGDEIHNNAHSCLSLGERLSRQAASVLLGAPACEAPAIRSAKAEKNLLTLRFANVRETLVFNSACPDDWGFTAEDAEGEIPVLSAEPEKDTLKLTLARAPKANTLISFAWQADPARLPPRDNTTFLPPLAFYRFVIS